MKQFIFLVSFFLVILYLPYEALAQPSNDDCANAIPLTVGTSCTTAYTNIDATANAPNGGVCNDASQTVWFSFVATQISHIVFLENFDFHFDASIALYSGTCGALIQASCTNVNGDGEDESVTFPALIIGNTYFIRVSGETAADEGTFCMYLLNSQPDNDDCGDAITIIPNADCTNGTNINSTSTGTNGSCNDNSQTVWYKFTAVEANNLITVHNYSFPNTDPNEEFDLDFALYNASGGGCLGTLIDCHNDQGKLISEQDSYTTLTPGNVYYIRVSGVAATDNDLFCIQVRDRPDNDLCTNATPLTLDGTCVEGGNIFATQSGSDPTNCGTESSGTVWYSFAPTVSQEYTFRLKDPRNSEKLTSSDIAGTIIGSNMTMGIYNSGDNTCTGVSNATLLSCINDTGEGITEVTTLSLTAGNTYFIKINGSTSTDQADFCIEIDSPPSNDDCTNATLLTVNNSCQQGTTYASGTSGVEPGSTCLNTDNTVWYKFVATSTRQTISITNLRGVGDSDLGYDLFTSTGTCASIGASAFCQDTGANGGSESAILTPFVVGATYYIRVSGDAATDETDFCIRVTSPPLNDLCSGVIPLTVNFSCEGGTTINSTALVAPPATISCGNDNAVVWYSFIATQTTHSVSFISQSTGADTDLVLEVFSSDDNTCSGVFNSLSCKNARGDGQGEETTITGLTIGNTYYVLVAGASATDEANFCISVTNANDLCTNATPLAINAQCVTGGNNGSTTTGATDGSCGLFDAGPQTTVWYSFIATTPSASITVEPESSFDPEVTLFSATGSCTGFSEADCIDNNGDGGIETLTTGSLTVGDTYYVLVDGWDSDEGEFCISVTSEIPCGNNPPPGNTCDAAPLINNLDGYCGITSNLYTRDDYTNLDHPAVEGGVSAFCLDGAGLHNNSFLTFTAGTPNITFEYSILTSAPLGGATCDQGLQMQIFSVTGNDCTTGTWEDTSGGCISPSGPSPSKGTITATGLITGQVYYIMFDGYAGDECGYSLRVPLGAGVILPIEMTSFTGKNLADVNRLTWTTVSEIEAEAFEVERSHNGMQFETIGKVIAKGNSQNLETYNFNDIEPIKGLNYYRLKMIDNDTTVNYSQTIDITNQGGGNDAQLFTFYPNPSIDFINYTVYSPDRGEYKFEFIDIQGKVIKWETKTLEKGNNFIREQEVVTLADGLYILKITGLYGSEILHHKFIKR